MEKQIFGTVYFDDVPVDVGSSLGEGKRFSIGDSIREKTIRWIKAGPLLVADRCICTNISWNQLDDLGFVHGAPVQIDGQVYQCRCLQTGASMPNGQTGLADFEDLGEWGAVLQACGKRDATWHWKDQYFWCQDTPNGYVVTRIVCGSRSPRFKGGFRSDDKRETVGFRPVLEMIPEKVELSRELIGSKLEVSLPQATLIGKLVSFDDYDVVVEPTGIPLRAPILLLPSGEVVVSREDISMLQKID